MLNKVNFVFFPCVPAQTYSSLSKEDNSVPNRLPAGDGHTGKGSIQVPNQSAGWIQDELEDDFTSWHNNNNMHKAAPTAQCILPTAPWAA